MQNQFVTQTRQISFKSYTHAHAYTYTHASTHTNVHRLGIPDQQINQMYTGNLIFNNMT